MTTVAVLAFLAVPLVPLVVSVQPVSADPVPSCAQPSKLVVPSDPNKPPYCECPAGQTLVTGNPNTCISDQDADQNCAATALGQNADGVKYCNAYMCADGTNPPSGNPGDCGKDPAGASGNCKTLEKCDLISIYLNPTIQLFSALVGIVIVISIVIGGIQYASSAGDPQAAAAAKGRIRNAIIALLAFLFLYALLNFLIPGGLFHG